MHTSNLACACACACTVGGGGGGLGYGIGDCDGGDGDGAAKVKHTYAFLEGLYAIINEKQVRSLLVSAVCNNSLIRCLQPS